MENKKFEEVDSNGKTTAVVSVEYLWGNLFVLKHNRPSENISKEIWMKLFIQAKEEAIKNKAGIIGIRLRTDYHIDLFQQILAELKFNKSAGRIEYKTNVVELPHYENQPLVWKTAEELGWDEEEIAEFTKKIIEDALDVEPEENPKDFIQDWLNHSEFTFGRHCISIGFFKENPIALTVVQVEKKSGWSRISYMGIIPSFRHQGFGKWVHRKGFDMIKEQGGTLYHGGTHIDNKAMRKLFEQHGCQFFCELEEWSFKV
jgi:hypothetical protein